MRIPTPAFLTCLIVVALAAPVLAAPIGYWNFDDAPPGNTTTTTAMDFSPNGNDATYAGSGAINWIAGKSGSAFQLGGGSSRFELADSSDLQVTGAVTVSAWVNPSGASNFGLIAGIDQTGGSANDMYTLKTSGTSDAIGNDHPRWDVVAAAGMGSNVSLDAPSTLNQYSALTTDGWVHVVGVLDPGVSADLYINGVSVAQDTTDVPMAIQLAATDFQFGHNASDSGGNPLLAAIDDIQVYDSALSPADVAFLFNNPGVALPVPEPSSLMMMVLAALVALGIGGRLRRRLK